MRTLPFWLGLSVLAACGESSLKISVALPPVASSTAVALASTNGCRLDDDCQAGLFCFQQKCVWECTADSDCFVSEVCSARARCIDPSSMNGDDGRADAGTPEPTSTEETFAVELASGGIEILEWPALALEVPSGAPFVEATLRTARPLPSGVLRYYFEVPDSEVREPPRVQRAQGSTEFVVSIPTGRASADVPEASAIQLVTPMGSRTHYLVPRSPRGGAYAGTFVPRSFGGGGLPLELVIETVPRDVLSLAEADEIYLWVPTTVSSLVSLSGQQEQADYVREPLTRDESIHAWVATFSQAIDAKRYLGQDLYPDAGRALRVELFEEDGDSLRGALSDRFLGLFERRSADGVVEPGITLVSGEFTLSRIGSVPYGKEVREAQDLDFLARPIDRPTFSSCDAQLFASVEGAGEEASPCAGIQSADQFRRAALSVRSACALGVANKVLEGETIAEMVRALLDPDLPNPGGMSFQEFLEACASESKPLCRPSPVLFCARELAADAYRDADASGSAMAALSEAYERTTREAFVGRKLAAFQVDTQSRLRWLQSAEAPPFLASTLREYNEQILEAWKTGVLAAHLEGVFGQLDRAGLSVLTRATTDPLALSRRRDLLLELASSWRAAMDALVLLSARWNVLLQNEVRRAEGAEFVRSHAFRLYVVAAVLQELNRETGSSHVGSTFGAGFSVLMRELARLSLPFDKLIFARDAEVVASRSINPERTARSMLRELEDAARKAVADSAASVDRVLEEAQNTKVDGAVLASRFEDQLLSLRNELIALCGLPSGCSPADVGIQAGCDVPVDAGRCGFLTLRGGVADVRVPTGAESVSEAGIALLSLQEAGYAKLEAEEKLRAHVQQASLTGATLEAFANKVREWDGQRRSVNREVEALLREARAIKDASIEAEVRQLQTDLTLRQQAYERQRAAVESWNDIRIAGVEKDLSKLQAVNALNVTSQAVGFAADRVDLFAKIFRDATPKVVGATTDPSFVSRLSIRFPAAIASSVLGALAFATNTAAASLDVTLAGQQALREAELTHLSDLAELGAQFDENQISRLEAAASLTNLQSDRATATIEALIDALDRNLELDLAHDRDLQELRDRRDAFRSMLADATRLEYEATQADLTGRQRELAYFEVVQRAQLLEGRFRNMQLRWQDLEGLLGSPDAMFSFANRMALAESRLDRARRALEDWLVALEYYAVRPFVDQRVAILLARNPSQLEAIANEMLRLQRVCGGPVTTETLTVSLRDDLLKMGFAVEDTGNAARTAAARFQALLRRTEAPVRRKMAYSARETLGQRMDRGQMLSATFDLQVGSFANLSRTCNAKLESVAVELVGSELGRGRPVVSIAYDGVGQLRSCQPDIAAYVGQFGKDATAFAPTTGFRTAGRVIAPVAGIGEFGPEKTWNASLEGLPLASQYTVLVDLLHPSNAAIDWSRVEDVRLKLRYGYQDVFPRGQCE